tara:strand:+ start:170 stop:928 length:759 start_codon:yes stop_codon:yes gene_type:complete
MSNDSRIATNLRTLLILEIFASAGKALSAKEVHAEIDLPYQTVHRLLVALESEGFLIRGANEKKFRATRRLRLMASGLLNMSHIHMLRHQILKDVAAKTRETVNYVVPQDSGMHYLDRVETDWAFRVQLPRGSNVPFHCTASGKIFMSSLKKAIRIGFVDRLRLKGETANTLTEKGRLLEELALTKKRGFALDNEEFMDGMVAIAVPVLDSQKRFMGALATHGPKSRMPYERLLEYRKILAEGAAQISRSMF